MTEAEADALYYMSESYIVGMYYYGHTPRDRALADLRAIQEEKSWVPLCNQTLEDRFEAILFEIDAQRAEIEGS